MIILSEYMNDPHGVELTEVFESESEIIRTDEVTFVSVNFFNVEEGERMHEYPENNRMFTWEGIEAQTDEEILTNLFILVPELQ